MLQLANSFELQICHAYHVHVSLTQRILNEIMYVEHSAQCLSQSKHLVQ